MIKFIKNQIIKQGKISEEKGKEKYSAYFVDTNIYADYKEEVDKLLTEEGFSFCIVEKESEE